MSLDDKKSAFLNAFLRNSSQAQKENLVLNKNLVLFIAEIDLRIHYDHDFDGHRKH